MSSLNIYLTLSFAQAKEPLLFMGDGCKWGGGHKIVCKQIEGGGGVCFHGTEVHHIYYVNSHRILSNSYGIWAMNTSNPS